jgi:hypothetical protein
MQTSHAGGERHSQRLTGSAFHVPPAYLEPNSDSMQKPIGEGCFER